MQLYSHAYHQLPASTKVTAIPYKLKPTIKTNLLSRELCLSSRQLIDQYQQGSLLCLIAKVRRERAAIMLAIDLVWIKAIKKVILQVTRACLRKVTNVTVEMKFCRNSVKTLTYLKAVATVQLLNLCKSRILVS